jgi:CRP/FNR family transcriptional regulator, cyclic AMP receptor protein
MAFLRTVSLFTEASEPDLAALWLRLTEKKLRPRELLFREGDPGEEMFLVRSGTIVISKHVTGRVEQVLLRLGPGEFFGEISLFDKLPRSATVQAETASVLMALDRANLERFIESNPRAASAFFYELLKVFIARLRNTTDLVAEVTRWGLESTGLDVEQGKPG